MQLRLPASTPAAWYSRAWCVLALALLASAPRLHALNEVVFEDIFARRLNEAGMVLVDWEGQIANPAIKIFLRPPSDATFPATAVVSAANARLYFDLPSQATASGPSKTVSFPNANPVPILVSIFPDRDGSDEDHTLNVRFTARDGAVRNESLGIHVIDQDQPQRGTDFVITLDYSKDRTGFFDDPAKRAVMEVASRDWAYFFGDMGLAPVNVGAEQTFIWNPDGFISGAYHTNSIAYRGYLLYNYGVSLGTPPFRSGGEASNVGGFQVSNGVTLPLRRSGGVEVEIKGNYNTLGWQLNTNDNDWWQFTNLGDTVCDLYSIVHHEMGHALIFHPNHTRWGSFKTAGTVNNSTVVNYLGAAPSVDATDHLPGTTDRLSGKGAFGNEYYGLMPTRRWMITKTDLLVAQAIGYTLRDTSAFTPLAITTTALAPGLVGVAFSAKVEARGGVPFYKWSLKFGALPPGLALNSFTGAITGRPTTPGTFSFTIEVAEYDAQAAPVSAVLSLRIAADAESPPAILIQPANQVAVAGTSAVFSVSSLGTVPLTYQWQKDGVAIAGATAATLTLANVQPSDAASYRVVITNIAGSVTSVAASLSVTIPGPTSRLSNVSVRTSLAANQTLIVGVNVSGGPRDILVRAAGPALTQFGVANPMLDPRLELIQAGTPVFSNDDWPGTLAPLFANLGAFAMTPGSKDAAFLQGLNGPYSIQCRSAGAGVVLVEAYDTGTANTPRLINLSARNRVGAGDDILIAGFNVAGTGAKSVLVRAVGPSLAAFGLTGVLADPKVQVFNAAGVLVAENDNWPATLVATFNSVGAFALESGSKDAALLTSLLPGGYTVQVRGADGGTGEALVEIYEVP